MGALETLRLARCPRCQRVFSICSHCDRGHVYCGRSCSDVARCDSLRRARRRHRRSPEGRLDHRDRERERRRRRRLLESRVGDHPSVTPQPYIKLEPTLDRSATSKEETVSPVEKVEIPDAPRAFRFAPFRVGWGERCRVCGRPGRWFHTAQSLHRGREYSIASP